MTLTNHITKSRIFTAYVVIIILLSVLPLNNGQANAIFILKLRADYLIHILLFMPWVWFYGVRKITFAAWIAFGIVFSAFSEVLQYLLPYRTFNINDLIANMAGVITGVMVWFILKSSFRKNKH